MELSKQDALVGSHWLPASADKKDKARESFSMPQSQRGKGRSQHEQGLACELAALHCLKHGDNEDATNLLKQANGCYTKWGSQVKGDLLHPQTCRDQTHESRALYVSQPPHLCILARRLSAILHCRFMITSRPHTILSFPKRSSNTNFFETP